MKLRIFLMLLGCVGLLFVMYVWGKVDVVRLGYTLEQLAQKRSGLKREQETLQLRLSQLTAPDRIAKRAKDRLDMRLAEPGQIVLVTADPEEFNQDNFTSEGFRVAKRPPTSQ